MRCGRSPCRCGQGQVQVVLGGAIATCKVTRVGDNFEFLKCASTLLLRVLNVLVLRCMMHDLLLVVCRTVRTYDLCNGALFAQMLQDVSALFQRSITQSTLDF